MSNRSCDVAVVPPTDDEVVFVGGRGITGGGGSEGMLGGRAPLGVGRWIGWLGARPGIANPGLGRQTEIREGEFSLQTFAT